ncbi:MAG: sugar-binding domain-containing protein, partial [Planctomycetota bacterium]
KPIAIPKNTAGIWPINLKMADVVLQYATAQLICRIRSEEGETFFFFAHDGIDAEYAFDPETLLSINAEDETVVHVKQPGTASVLRVKSKSGQTIRICTLTKKQAMQMYRFTDLWDQPRIVMADADVLYGGNGLDVRSMGKSSGTIGIYPAPNALRADREKLQSVQNGIFKQYNWSVPKQKIVVELSDKKRITENVLTNELHWICASKDSWAPLSCFRKTINISNMTKIQSAQFVFRADDNMELWINGSSMGTAGTWDSTASIDLTSKLDTGENVIACRVPNAQGPGGLVGRILITDTDGHTKILPVDASFKASGREVSHWQNLDFDDSSWSDATLVSAFKQGASAKEIALYDLSLPTDSLKGVYDVFLDVDWVGDMLEVKRDGVLIADWFYYGPRFRPSLRHWGPGGLGKKLEIRINPITPQTKCYIEPEYRPDFSVSESLSEIRGIKAIPQYRIILSTN